MGMFWIDDAYDREHGGRFARLVDERPDAFADAWGDIAPSTFAAVAWTLAVAPALTPGYVRFHRRVVEAGLARNPYDGGLTATVVLAVPWPAALHTSRVWERDRGWRGWPEAFGQFVDPSAQDLARGPHLRASVRVDAPLPLDGYPPAPSGPADGVAAAARRAVTVTVRALNELLDPLNAEVESA